MCNTQESNTTENRTDTPPSESREKQYAEILSGKNGTSHKLTVRTKDNQTETVKTLIKSNIDPTHMKIGIRKFKWLQNGKVRKVLIEADRGRYNSTTRSDNTQMWGQAGNTVQKTRKRRMIICNIPDYITMDNAAEIIHEQNPELTLKNADITKFITKNKRNSRNIIEVDTKT